MTNDKNQNHKLEMDYKEYLYTSSQIKEREGHIPGWLIWLGVGVFIWGTYYVVAFWNPS